MDAIFHIDSRVWNRGEMPDWPRRFPAGCRRPFSTYRANPACHALALAFFRSRGASQRIRRIGRSGQATAPITRAAVPAPSLSPPSALPFLGCLLRCRVWQGGHSRRQSSWRSFETKSPIEVSTSISLRHPRRRAASGCTFEGGGTLTAHCIRLWSTECSRVTV